MNCWTAATYRFRREVGAPRQLHRFDNVSRLYLSLCWSLFSSDIKWSLRTSVLSMKGQWSCSKSNLFSNTQLQHFTPVPMATGLVVKGTLTSFPDMFPPRCSYRIWSTNRPACSRFAHPARGDPVLQHAFWKLISTRTLQSLEVAGSTRFFPQRVSCVLSRSVTSMLRRQNSASFYQHYL